MEGGRGGSRHTNPHLLPAPMKICSAEVQLYYNVIIRIYLISVPDPGLLNLIIIYRVSILYTYGQRMHNIGESMHTAGFGMIFYLLI